MAPGRPPLPRRVVHALVGTLLAVGAPLGLAVLRASPGGEPWLGRLRAELAGDPATYLYLLISTVLVFSLFGYVLGCQADRLLELSATDPLTRLRNRRAFYERLEEELARSARYRQPLSLLLVDVDRLKEINDSEGHRAGDAALAQVADAIRSGSRVSDLGARWGGDEFALLAPNTAGDAALSLAERVRSLVAGEGGAATTVSIGVATFAPPGAAPSVDDLVRAADAALYEAKRLGRNRVVAG